MKPIHIALALGLTLVWGMNFVSVRYGLNHYPPLFFAALRFVVAALPIAFVAPPKIALSRLLAISGALFVGQFAFQFPGMQLGFPPGLTSLVMQAQVFFTVLLATSFLGERPRARNYVALVIAFAGLALIAATAGGNGVTIIGLVLIVASALCWAIGNVLLRASPGADMFSLVCWASLPAIAPLLALSLIFEGPAAGWEALTHPAFTGVVAVFYVGLATTVVGYWVWGELLKRYTAAIVTPFALLVPVTGTVAAHILFGESFGALRLAGMALIMAGLVVNTLPVERWLKPA